jgi:tetratricopeptide (TPR) repeat protein
LLKRSPADVDALNAQFRLAMSSKDLVTAKSVADALIALRPKDAVGYVFEGMVAEAAGHADEALRYATQAADLAPQTAEPLEAVVRLLVAAKRAPEALRRLDAVAAVYPRESFALTLKGELLLRSGQSAAALDAFQQAIARTPTWWAPYSDRASAELANKEAPAVVIARLRQAKAVVTQPNPIALRLASLFESAGKVDDAIKEYDEVLSRDPDSEVAANNLALLLVNAKTDAASLNRAKELSARFAKSTNLAYVDTYAWVLARGGDAAQSVPLLAGVVQQAPNAVLARYHLGVAQALAGDSAAARASLTRVVNSGVQFSGLDDAKSVLQKLSKTPGTSAAPPGWGHPPGRK